MRRLKAASALVLTAFFAVAGAYHHHRLPPPTHDHTGLCSNTSVVPSLDSCAICRSTHTAAHRLAAGVVEAGLDRVAPLTVTRAFAPPPVDPSFPHGSRAPPTV